MAKAEGRFLQLISVTVLCIASGCCSPAYKGADNEHGRLLRHVILFEFKETTTKEQIKETERLFCEMAREVNEIKNFEWGTDVNNGKRAQGFTHCFVLTFTSEAGRDKYMSHSAHSKLRDATKPYIKKMLVLDYWERGN
jgi:hypothetical protein